MKQARIIFGIICAVFGVIGCNCRQALDLPAPISIAAPADTERQPALDIIQTLSGELQEPGLDVLGGVKFCQALVDSRIHFRVLGFFAVEFGDALPCVERLFKLGVLDDVRIELTWQASHHYTDADFKIAVDQAKRYEALRRKYPGHRIFLSPTCEHQLNAPDAQRSINMVAAAAPSVDGYVNVPWTGALLPATGKLRNEQHRVDGKHPPAPFFESTDGTSVVDIDAEKWKKDYAGAQVLLAHVPLFNCRQNGTTAGPKQRTVCAGADFIRSVYRLLQPKGPIPAFPWPTIRFGGKNILKSHAEDSVQPKGGSDPRANHLVVLIVDNVPSIKVKDARGHVLETIQRFPGNPMANGTYRYYSKYYGFQLGKMALKSGGSEWVAFCAGSHNYIGNPAFREPPH